jgi:hypothetical protein
MAVTRRVAVNSRQEHPDDSDLLERGPRLRAQCKSETQLRRPKVRKRTYCVLFDLLSLPLILPDDSLLAFTSQRRVDMQGRSLSCVRHCVLGSVSPVNQGMRSPPHSP